MSKKKRNGVSPYTSEPTTLAEVTPGTVVSIVGCKRPVRVGGSIASTHAPRSLVTEVRDDGIEVGGTWCALRSDTKVRGVVSERRSRAPIRHDLAELGKAVADPLGGDGDGDGDD